MATENNALKELEKSLIRDHETIAKKCGCGFASVFKAQQIIAELAKEFEPIDHSKVKPSEDGRVHFGDILKYGDKRRCDILAKCREIAEKKVD